MDALLKGFLNSEDSKTKPPTHTLMDGGKFYVPENKLTLFYKKILKHSFVKGETVPPIVERMTADHPFIVDIDIKYKDKLSERQYTDETLEKVVSYLYAKLSDYLELDTDDGEVWVMFRPHRLRRIFDELPDILEDLSISKHPISIQQENHWCKS